MTKKREAELLEIYYRKGDFFKTRRKSKNLLSNKDTDSSLRKKAQKFLHMTGVDKFAIIAGLGALAFVILITIIIKLIGN